MKRVYRIYGMDLLGQPPRGHYTQLLTSIIKESPNVTMPVLSEERAGMFDMVHNDRLPIPEAYEKQQRAAPKKKKKKNKK